MYIRREIHTLKSHSTVNLSIFSLMKGASQIWRNNKIILFVLWVEICSDPYLTAKSFLFPPSFLSLDFFIPLNYLVFFSHSSGISSFQNFIHNFPSSCSWNSEISIMWFLQHADDNFHMMIQFVCVKKLVREPKKGSWPLKKDAFSVGSVTLALEVQMIIFSWALSQLKAGSWWCYEECSCGYVLDLPFWKNIRLKSWQAFVSCT